MIIILVLRTKYAVCKKVISFRLFYRKRIYRGKLLTLFATQNIISVLFYENNDCDKCRNVFLLFYNKVEIFSEPFSVEDFG